MVPSLIIFFSSHVSLLYYFIQFPFFKINPLFSWILFVLSILINFSQSINILFAQDNDSFLWKWLFYLWNKTNGTKSRHVLPRIILYFLTSISSHHINFFIIYSFHIIPIPLLLKSFRNSSSNDFHLPLQNTCPINQSIKKKFLLILVFFVHLSFRISCHSCSNPSPPTVIQKP